MAIMPPPGTKTRKTGVMFRLTLGGPDYEVEVERAPDNAGAPDTANSVFFTLAAGTTLWLDELPADNAYRHWRFRHIGVDVNPSAWTAWTKAKPVLYLIDSFNDSQVWGRPQRGESYTDGSYSVKGSSSSGDVVAAGVAASDGVAARVLVKAGETQTVRDGDAVTFAPAFQNPPRYTLRGGIHYEPRSGQWSPSYDATKPQYPLARLVNLTGSGATVLAKVRQKGAQAAQVDDFPTANALDVIGETADANLDPGGAANDTYTVRFDVQLRVAQSPTEAQSATVTVAVRSNDGAGWVDRWVGGFTAEAPIGGGNYVETNWTNQARAVVVSGLALNDDLRVEVRNATGEVWSFLVHAHDTNDTLKGVTYTTATDATASMTPDTDDTLELDVSAA
jgi:hypothetical protein